MNRRTATELGIPVGVLENVGASIFLLWGVMSKLMFDELLHFLKAIAYPGKNMKPQYYDPLDPGRYHAGIECSGRILI